jgi:O-antigen/teichoic acid export membrane protein
MTSLAQPESLRARVARGARWKLVGQVAAQLSRAAVTITLARLLSPRDFGLAGMVLVFAGMIQLFADFGFSASIIQQKELTRDDRATAFWINTTVGVALTCLGVAAAPLLGRFYSEPQVTVLFIALSLNFAIAALGSTHAALLMREMNFRALEIVGMIGAVVGAAAGVSVGLLGGGAWAIISQSLATSVVTTALLWRAHRWVPVFGLSRASLRKHWTFGASVFGARIFAYLSQNADNFLIGRFLGAAPLGIYSIAYTAILMPFDRIMSPLQALLRPAFAALQDDLERTRDIWIRGLRLSIAVMAPLCFGLVVVTPDFVHVVLGRRWDAAIPVVRVLAYAAFAQTLIALSSLVFANRYRTDLGLKTAGISFVAHLTGFVVGLHWGVLGVAVGFAISTTAVAVPLTLAATARVVQLPVVTLVRGFDGVLGAGAVAIAVAAALRGILIAADVPAALRLAAVVVAAAAVYLPLCAWWDPATVAELPLPARLRMSKKRGGGHKRDVNTVPDPLAPRG